MSLLPNVARSGPARAYGTLRAAEWGAALLREWDRSPGAVKDLSGAVRVKAEAGGAQIRSGVMSVPLDLQRKCEQRWLARFARSARSADPQWHEVDSQNQQLAAPAKAEKKTDRVEAAGLKSAPAA